jgi:hypothetical protein
MRLALVVVLALASTAHANRWSRLANDVQGGAWLHYELTVLQDVDDRDAAPGFHELVLAGARLHGFVGGNPTIGYHVGLDLAAGSTLRGAGFAYDVALFPLGVGLRIGTTSIVTLGAGVGALGAVGTIDDAVTLPLEANAELGGGRVRVLARARVAYVAGAPSRHDGSPSAPFADELDTMLGVRFGHHYDDYGFPSGNGYFGGLAYRELAGVRYLGLAIGYSIDLATPRDRGHHRCC